MSLKDNKAVSTIGKLYRVFSKKQQKAFNWLIFFTFIGSVTDLVGLAFVIPIVGLVLSETFYESAVRYLPFISGYSKNTLLLYAVGLFFVLIILKNVVGLLINKLQVNFVKNLYVTSSMNVLDKLYDRSLLNLQKDTSNELIIKLTNYQFSLSSEATISMIVIINEMMIFTMSAIIICTMNWQLFLLLVGVLMPIMGLFYSKVKSRIKEASHEKVQNRVKLNADGQEMIFGYTDIKIAGTEDYFKSQFRDYAVSFSNHQGKLDFMMFMPTRIIEVAIFLCVTMILLYGVYVIKEPEKIVTTITLFSIIAYRCIPSINRFFTALNVLKANHYLFDDPDFIHKPADEHEHDNDQPFSFNEQISFDHVSYSYPGSDKNVIDDCTLQIGKGEKIGIIGKSGAGKSTLIGTILGFLYPTSGKILVDGKQLTSESITGWWKTLGYVKQDVFIMNAILLENIAIGETAAEADMNRLEHAIRLSQLSELVSSLPDGVQTLLNERGNNLSGGQKQRIAIARAIYKGAQLLVFDEATSALDTKTEEEVTNSIRELGKEHLTIVIIAHRYTSLKYCDKIYQLDNGRIGKPFSYAELMAMQNPA